MAFAPGLIFISLTAAIAVLIVVVVILEKMIKKKKELTVTSPEYILTGELRELKKANLEPAQMLVQIDLLAKKGLGQQSGIGHTDYSQLAEMNKEKRHIVEFCSQMTESLYAGERLTPAQVRNLLGALEDMLKGEGKIMLITPRQEILEGKTSSFFLDKMVESMAKRVNMKLEEMRRNRAEKESAKMKAASEAADMKKAELQAKEDEKKAAAEDDKMPEFKKEVIARPQKGKKLTKADRKEYKYIESVDVLDRIQSKLKDKKAVKI